MKKYNNIISNYHERYLHEVAKIEEAKAQAETFIDQFEEQTDSTYTGSGELMAPWRFYHGQKNSAEAT